MNKDIPSYELCKRLKELGYPQETLLLKVNEYSCGIYYNEKWEHQVIIWKTSSLYSYAPTIWEMMDVLPKRLPSREYGGFDLWISFFQEYFVTYRPNTNKETHYVKQVYSDKSLPNALAKMLIRTIEEWYLDINSK